MGLVSVLIAPDFNQREVIRARRLYRRVEHHVSIFPARGGRQRLQHARHFLAFCGRVGVRQHVDGLVGRGPVGRLRGYRGEQSLVEWADQQRLQPVAQFLVVRRCKLRLQRRAVTPFFENGKEVGTANLLDHLNPDDSRGLLRRLTIALQRGDRTIDL